MKTMEGNMKKTTWVIIGLSLCVVVLSTALGIVLLQNKTETIIVSEPDPYTSSIKPWQFSLSPRIYKRYYWGESYRKSEPVQIGPTRYIIPGVPGKVVGLKSPNKY